MIYSELTSIFVFAFWHAQLETERLQVEERAMLAESRVQECEAQLHAVTLEAAVQLEKMEAEKKELQLAIAAG